MIIVAVGALLLLAGGVGAFFVLNQNKGSSESNDSNPGSDKSSIQALLGGGKNVSCSVSYEQGSGTVYVADKKMYGEFDTTVEDQSYKGYVINDGEYSYTWSSQSTQGIKFKADATDQPTTQEDKSGVDLNQEGDVDCRSWSVDNSKFTPPSSVTFTDFTSTINQTQDQTNQLNEQQKAACNQIADPSAKAACLDALN